MNNLQDSPVAIKKKPERTLDVVNRGLGKRYRAERRFRLYGLLAIIASLIFLSLLFISIIGNGYSAFQQTFIQLDVFFDPDILKQESLATANYQGLVKQTLRTMFPDAISRGDKRMLYGLVSSGASFQLRDLVLKNPEIIGQTRTVWVPADDDVDMVVKGHLKQDSLQGEGRLKNIQMAWI